MLTSSKNILVGTMFQGESKKWTLFISHICPAFYCCTNGNSPILHHWSFDVPLSLCLLFSPGLQLPLMITEEDLALPGWSHHRRIIIQVALWRFGKAPDSPPVFQRHTLFQATVKIIFMDYLQININAASILKQNTN